MSASSFSKFDEFGFERPKGFDYHEYEKFMKVYLTILAKQSRSWSCLLIYNQPLRKGVRLQKYIRKGIPLSLRSQVWSFVSDIPKMKEEYESDLYKKMLRKSVSPDIKEIITVDTPRTFPENIYFNQTLENQEALFRILYAFAANNPYIGYCQGLNYIAGLLLLVTKDEEVCFWLLKVLIEKKLPDYYSKTMNGVIIDIEVFSRLVQKKFPDVSDHMNSIGMHWALIVTKWFICLFVEVLPVENMFSEIGPLPMSLIEDLRLKVLTEQSTDKTTYQNRKKT
ncbi:growth hormone-regulated TBC protein 1-like isoform X2 [Daktulosphaira vitifoliae]|uniref:growth hormone-regulated TBC protein 1-like isoform X2 n=1 Tax=Daktulosphaira vitifoliae TaxID=58002 RepID=UPI0021AA00C3|nr:growth hormone-regulated TBC protein 1-like isoform X2 [Daktulosphaira vitifoliae]